VILASRKRFLLPLRQKQILTLVWLVKKAKQFLQTIAPLVQVA